MNRKFIFILFVYFNRDCGAQQYFGPAPFIRWGPKAQAEEGYGPDTVIQEHWDTAEDDSVLGQSKVSSEERVKMV